MIYKSRSSLTVFDLRNLEIFNVFNVEDVKPIKGNFYKLIKVILRLPKMPNNFSAINCLFIFILVAVFIHLFVEFLKYLSFTIFEHTRLMSQG